MDRVVLLVVILGILLGSLQALSMQARDAGFSSLPETQKAPPQARGASLEDMVAESHTVDVGDYDPDVDGIRTAMDGAGKSDEAFNVDGGNVPAAPPASISSDEEGLTAYYAETNTRYLFSGHTLALATLASGAEYEVIESSVSDMGGMIAERVGDRLLLVIPSGSLDRLTSLLEKGSLVSIEEGGWGPGLGKG